MKRDLLTAQWGRSYSTRNWILKTVTKQIDSIKIELENPDTAFDPNDMIDGIWLFDFMTQRCTTYPDLCDHLSLCPCEEGWYSGEDGLEALALMVDNASELTSAENRVAESLRRTRNKISKLELSYRFTLVSVPSG